MAVVTGASSGIGCATAEAFAKDDARLVLAARNRTALDEVATDCREIGAQVPIVPTDVPDAQAVAVLAGAAIDEYGCINVWINNVGEGAVGPKPRLLRTAESSRPT